MEGRIGKQCRERWHNHLNPKINKNQWQDKEEWVLFLCHKLKGNKWAEITSFLPGRTDNAIKNHWNSSMKKRLNEMFQKFIKIKNSNFDRNFRIQDGIYKEYENILLEQLVNMQEDDVEIEDYLSCE